jgi:hypothetical protein
MRSSRYGVMMVTLSLAVLTALMPPARADEGGEAALRQQLEEVRRQLNELQLKLERMEAEHAAETAAPPAPVAAPPAAPAANSTTSTPPAAGPPATTVPVPPRVEAARAPATPAVPDAFQWREALKEQWSGVKAGMNGEQIRQLLGAPSREFALDGRPVWYYNYPGVGNGSVLFGRDGGTVVGWQHPPFGFW